MGATTTYHNQQMNQAAFLRDLVHDLEEIRNEQCTKVCHTRDLTRYRNLFIDFISDEPHSQTCSEITAIIQSLRDRLSDLP